jgi:hypothetical protein
MINKTIFKALILTSFFIISFGIYRVCEVFYSYYFNQIEYTQLATIGNKAMLTKTDVLLSEFKNIKTIMLSLVTNFFIVFGKKLYTKKSNL